jgi:hypothetical protein
MPEPVRSWTINSAAIVGPEFSEAPVTENSSANRTRDARAIKW